MKQQLATTQAPAALGPYSQAIGTGSLVFVSGQLPIDPKTGTMPEGIVAQTTQALDNAAAILSEAGLTLDDVVKTTVYLTDPNDFAGMNEAYAARFGTPYPARSAIAATMVKPGALVEIEVIAAR